MEKTVEDTEIKKEFCEETDVEFTDLGDMEDLKGLDEPEVEGEEE